MPTWSNQLPAQSDSNAFDLCRTPPDAPLRGVVTCADLNVCLTHFWGGRTMPCETPDCPACRAMSPKRAHVYVSAYDITSKHHFIFECTALAAEPFRDWIREAKTLRGCCFQATRPKRRRNAPVQIITKAIDLTKFTLPPPPDVAAAMSIIWRLPKTATSIEPDQACATRIATASEITNRMRHDPADDRQATELARRNGQHS